MEWALSTKAGSRVDCDVAVIGAGPSGAIMALLIARAGLSAHLIHPPQRTDLGRAETVSLRGQLPLDARDLADLLRETAIAPIRRFASRWGPEISQRGAMLSVDGSQVIVERRSLDRALCGAAKHAGAVMLEHKVRDFEWRNGCWHLCLDNEQVCAAHVIVDATGRAASIARRLGAKLFTVDKLVAETACCPGDVKEHQILIEAAANGWLFGATDALGRQTISYFYERAGRPSRAKCLAQACEQSDWFADLAPRFSHLDTEMESAATQFVECSVLRRALVIGDAAQTCDPLSSNGVSTAINDAKSAATALIDAFAGNIESLWIHERERRLRFFRYLKLRQSYYALESRWPDQPFWKTRASGDDVRKMLSHLARYSADWVRAQSV
jgi:flavin-dependent dehydrogenase